MKKQIVPISSSDGQDHSMASSSKNGRSRIRLRRSSSKNKNSDNGKRQQQQKFSKRPYLYKSGEHSPTKQTRSGIHFNNLISENNNQDTPVHWIDWIDSGMELFGCGIATANAHDLSSHTNKPSSRLDSTNTNTQSHYQQKDEDIAAIQKRHKELMERDYIQLHEDFFDSLLKEEGNQMLGSILAAVAAMSLQQTESRDGINGVGSSSYSVTSAMSSVSSAVTAETDTSGISRNNNDNNNNNIKTPSISSTRTIRNDHCWGNADQKRRKRTTANIEEYDQLYNPDLTSTATQIGKIKSSSFSSSSTRHSSSSNNNNNNTSAQSSNIINDKKSSSSSVLCIKDIMAKEYLEPSGYYVHPQCRLQKDKGKGDRLESCISATGRDLCLEKLRDKMKLIIEVSGELQAMSFNNELTMVTTSSSKSSNNTKSAGSTNNDITSNYKAMSAGMKRRRAKIASIEKNSDCSEGRDDGSCVIETRSMIELQLGFLSMQYGLLLRWDAYRTGQIVYVCLRKMCHDSFYTKIPSAPVITTTNSQSSRQCMKHKQQQIQNEQSLNVASSRGLDNGSNGPPRIIAASKKREVTSPLVVRSRKGGNHAIYQRASGATEVVLVDAPYHVPQPEVFAPSVLTLDIHQLTGLDPKSRWTLSMTFDGHTEIAHLIYNQQERVFETTRTTPCKWEMVMVPHKPVTSFDVATGLDIRLFEQRPKQRLRGVVSVGGIIKRSSSTSSLVPPGRDPFSLTSSSNSYIIQNQRLIHYDANNNGKTCSSESSIGSSNSFIGSISSRNSLKKSTSRLASTMTVPLGGLVSQPSTSQTALWKLTIPFTHDEDAHVNLTLMHQSDYAYWLYRELRARRKEELALTSAAFPLVGESGSGSDLWRCLISSRNSNNEDDSEEDEDSDDNDLYFLDWLIYCCFDPR